MNVYLLFALAFGAVTGVAEVRVARPAAVSPAVADRAERQALFADRRSPIAVETCLGDRRPAIGDPVEAKAPLTGAATPRAPAANC